MKRLLRINGVIAFVDDGAFDFREAGDRQAFSLVETGAAEYVTDDPDAVRGLVAAGYGVLDGYAGGELLGPHAPGLPTATVYELEDARN